jgi:hypothetical protein
MSRTKILGKSELEFKIWILKFPWSAFLFSKQGNRECGRVQIFIVGLDKFFCPFRTPGFNTGPDIKKFNTSGLKIMTKYRVNFAVPSPLLVLVLGKNYQLPLSTTLDPKEIL